MDLEQEADILRKVPLLAKLDPSKLKLLAFTSQLLSFEDSETVFRKGDSADCAYVIMAGQADIIAETEAGEVLVGTLETNQLVGELAVLTNSPRSATIRARGHLLALRVDDQAFLKLLADNPEVAIDVMRQLSRKLLLAHHQFETLQTRLKELEARA